VPVDVRTLHHTWEGEYPIIVLSMQSILQVS
jgi:hypothetical protein